MKIDTKKEKCRICNSTSNYFFEKKVLLKYKVSYFCCENCGFIQTENPYWLEESYSSAITSMDVGLIARNIKYANIVDEIICKFFDKNARFLDFAGGYGMFTRMMRDKGFDFYHEDKYCKNMFADFFTIDDLQIKERKFELITAFEFMEHSVNPFEELGYIFSLTDSFLFSTELIPEQDIETWWYLGFEHGQHISFYTKDSLEKIAKKYNKNYFNKGSMHLFTSKVQKDVFKGHFNLRFLMKRFLSLLDSQKQLTSRTQSDFDFINSKKKV